MELVGALELGHRSAVVLLLGQRDAAIEVLARFRLGVDFGQREGGQRAENKREGGGSTGGERHRVRLARHWR